MISSRAGAAWSTIGPVSTQQAPTRQHMTCSSTETPSPPPPSSPEPPPPLDYSPPPHSQSQRRVRANLSQPGYKGVITGKHSSHTQNAHTTPPHHHHLPAYSPGLHPLPHTHIHTNYYPPLSPPATQPPPSLATNLALISVMGMQVATCV